MSLSLPLPLSSETAIHHFLYYRHRLSSYFSSFWSSSFNDCCSSFSLLSSSTFVLFFVVLVMSFDIFRLPCGCLLRLKPSTEMTKLCDDVIAENCHVKRL